MKEIGGYFELENFVQEEYYDQLLSFSSARNCLLYVLKKRHIKKIFLPYFLCDVISKICSRFNVEVVFYSIDEDFVPILNCNEVTEDSYLYIVNYYGWFTNKEIKKLYQLYHYVIVDNTHSFFQNPLLNVDTIYNCRKYFGVPDGAYLSTDLDRDNQILTGKSGNRFKHLVGRYEGSANDFYLDFKKADESFDYEDLFYMSKLTKNLMGAIDYQKVHLKRIGNYNYLKEKLLRYNELDLSDKELDFMFPFYTKYAVELRKKLIENKVYVPILWPNVLLDTSKDSIEYHYANYILPLPIDQRYNLDDMNKIIFIIEEFYNKL